MVFRSFNGRFAAGLMVAGFVLSVAGCQSVGKALDNGALKPDTPKVKASDLRAYCPKVTLRDGTAYFNTYATGTTAKPKKKKGDAAADAQAEAIRDHVMPELATKADIAELKHMIERQTLQITVRLGGLIVIGVGVLAALKLLP